MRRHREVGVTERLEQPDLHSLRADHPPEHDVDQERGDEQEYGWDHLGHRLELHQLVVEEGVAHMVLAPIGAGAAVGREDCVDLTDHVGFRRAAPQREGERVDGLGPVGRRLKRFLAHPEYSETGVVGNEIAGRQRIDIVGREPDADDRQALARAVDECVNACSQL
jgi:hypothetical protein